MFIILYTTSYYQFVTENVSKHSSLLYIAFCMNYNFYFQVRYEFLVYSLMKITAYLVQTGLLARSHWTASKKAAFQKRKECQIGCSRRKVYRKHFVAIFDPNWRSIWDKNEIYTQIKKKQFIAETFTEVNLNTKCLAVMHIIYNI